MFDDLETCAGGAQESRPKTLENRLLIAVFAIYVVLLMAVAWRHEPWFDEAQAWLLARDAGPVELLAERLRYEGTPGLWHLLLMVPAKLGLPFRTLSVISAILAAATVYLFLRYSPFCWYVKVLFPFGFFTFYQYAVVARSYTLMALLLVSIAVIFHERNRRPIVFFVLLALLANVNLHGFVMAGFLTLYHLWQLWLERSEVPKEILRRHMIGAVGLALIALLVILQLVPPDNLGFPANEVKLLRARFLLDALTLNRPLSVCVLALSGLWFWRQRVFFLWAAPTAGLLALFVYAWAAPWHEGVVYYHWVFCMWLALERSRPARSESQKPAPAWLAPAVQAVVALVLAYHLRWSIVCSCRDFAYAYSGSRAACSYLVKHRLHEREIYAHGFSTISLLPYFRQNVFDNYHHKQNPSYLVWAQDNPLLQARKSLFHTTPQYVLVGVKLKGDEGLDHPDYELIRRFEGRLFWKDGVLEPDDFLLYRRRKHRAGEGQAVG